MGAARAGRGGRSEAPLSAVDLAFITPADPPYADELELRFRVLREPLGHPRTAVPFPFEEASLHLVALDRGKVIGCVLFHPESERTGRLFQMAVVAGLQKGGIGTQLVRRLEEDVRVRGFFQITLHARAAAVPFYERLGYACFGEPFTEVGLPHRHMRRDL
jgi:GNAT superfamily N-acetyltransferase